MNIYKCRAPRPGRMPGACDWLPGRRRAHGSESVLSDPGPLDAAQRSRCRAKREQLETILAKALRAFAKIKDVIWPGLSFICMFARQD